VIAWVKHVQWSNINVSVRVKYVLGLILVHTSHVHSHWYLIIVHASLMQSQIDITNFDPCTYFTHTITNWYTCLLILVHVHTDTWFFYVIIYFYWKNLPMFLACLFTYYIKISNLMGRFFTFLVLLEVLENGFYGRFGEYQFVIGCVKYVLGS
jgi:hypothetical protein